MVCQIYIIPYTKRFYVKCLIPYDFYIFDGLSEKNLMGFIESFVIKKLAEFWNQFFFSFVELLLKIVKGMSEKKYLQDILLNFEKEFNSNE